MNRHNDISIADILHAIKRRAILLISITVTCATAGLLYAIFAAPVYSATVIAVLADPEEGGLSSMMGGFASAAALAGINLGESSNEQTYLAILRSQQLADKFIADNNLLPFLFPDRWDESAKSWKNESSFFTRWSGEQSAAPTAWQGYQRLQKIRRVEEDAAAGTIKVSFRFKDPALAAKWANDYLALANAEIRNRTVHESSQALDYLNRQAELTKAVGLKDTIYRLVESHLEKIALANARQEYAFRVVDRATPPEERSHPRRKLILALSIFAGIFIGVFVTLIIESFANGLRRTVESRPS